MKKYILVSIQILSLLIALSVEAEDVGLHKKSAQPKLVTDTPVLKAQTTNPARIPIVLCQDVANYPIGEPQAGQEFDSVSADNVVTPLIERELYRRARIRLSDVSLVSILEEPKHGKLYPYPNVKGAWGYLSQSGYKGHDRVMFMIEGKGKKVRVVVNLLVGIVDDRNPVHCKKEAFGSV